MNALKLLLSLPEGKSLTYEQYRSLLANLHAEDKTTGDDQGENYVNFSKLNDHRMNRLDKKGKLTDDTLSALQNIQVQTWYVISEGWCGDAAQNVPFLQKMADASESIDLKIVLRDENPDIMNGYLTNGGRSIPKVIACSEEGKELFVWGPRPAPVQKIVMDNKKADPPLVYEELQIDVQKWYAKDKGVTLQEEFMFLLKERP